MDRPVERIIIVGGGTAGWLSAATLAARRSKLAVLAPSITLIEAPDIPTVGVGEGTWPTMRETLAQIGIGESEFLLACDGSFKQGSRFDAWRDGSAGDSYLHPFTAPPPRDPSEMVQAWYDGGGAIPFAFAVTAQAEMCARDLAPRQRAMPDFAGALNYGYHLDAVKLAALLKRHAVDRLGVRHLADQVVVVESDDGGDIAAVTTRDHGRIEGDLFIDCTGHAALLIGGHFGAGWIDRSDILFNDRALAVQLPVAPGSPIASQTIGTAHEAGWLWDIGLPTRRGVGCVYSSRFTDDARAEAILHDYVEQTSPGFDPATLSPRRLSFPTGHRDQFWKGNCLAIGLAAGFIEPLEASAIVLAELSLRALAENFPASRAAMKLHARRFNTRLRERWDRIIDFLKLHYLLSQRHEAYWRAHRAPASVPAHLADLLLLWRDQPPSPGDFPLLDEMFPAASYQYVYYGMGGAAPNLTHRRGAPLDRSIGERARSLAAALPTNRAYLDALRNVATSQPQKVPAF